MKYMKVLKALKTVIFPNQMQQEIVLKSDNLSEKNFKNKFSASICHFLTQKLIYIMNEQELSRRRHRIIINKMYGA